MILNNVLKMESFGKVVTRFELTYIFDMVCGLPIRGVSRCSIRHFSHFYITMVSCKIGRCWLLG